MSPKVVEILLGRIPSSRASSIFGFRRHPVREFVFPGSIPSSNPLDKVDGVLLEGLADPEVKILDWFEGDEYKRVTVSVEASIRQSKTEESSAYLYLWNNPREELETEQNWDFDTFCANDLANYLRYTVEPCRVQLDNLYPDETYK